MKTPAARVAALFVLAVLPLQQALAQPGLDQGADITVYPHGEAVISERRTLTLAAGTTQVTWPGAPERIRPETAVLRALDGSGFRVLEQVFSSGNVRIDSLLREAQETGRTITWLRENAITGQETPVPVDVLATGDSLVLRIAGRIEIDPPGRPVFDTIPPGHHLRPSLGYRIDAGQAGPVAAELTYLSGGFDWRADYVAEVDESGIDKTGGGSEAVRLGLTGWASITNRSGRTFTDASVRLAAGEINRAPRALPAQAAPMMTRAWAVDEGPAPVAEPEAVGGLHLYALPGRVDLKADQTRRFTLFDVGDVPARLDYVSEGGGRFMRPAPAPVESRAEGRLSFDNTEEKGPGKPVPAGTAQVFIRDSQGVPRLAGEDLLSHTEVGGTVRLRLGPDFDLPVTRTQSAFSRLGERAHESSWEVRVKNAKDRDVQVRIIESLAGDWRITRENLPHERLDAGRAQWTVTVPAGGESVLTYTVRIHM